MCVGYLGGKRDWIPRSHALSGNEESSPRKRRTPRSSHRAWGCGATGGPRCHGWQRGPGTQPLVVQGLAGPRKARCHVATHFKTGNEGQTDQDRQRQSNALAQAASQSAARKNGTRSLLPTRSGGTRNLPKEKTHTRSVTPAARLTPAAVLPTILTSAPVPPGSAAGLAWPFPLHSADAASRN
jgi:hypothetical protein